MCLLRKIANCLLTPSFMGPKAASFIISSARMMSSGIATHMFKMPRPVGAGRYR
ncbi:hypothetical protein Y695_03660 [Hydrogenophaga sp. T4]|nr:hypothetical protein Y695_03660 [Hydrogenophaga sp. T4]